WLLVLALLTLVAEAWLAGRRGERFLRVQGLRSGNPLAPRRRAVLALRAGALALLILAIVDPRTPIPTRSAGAVLVTDDNATPAAREATQTFVAEAVEAAGRRRPLGTVQVGAEGRITADLGSAATAFAVLDSGPPAADLGAALRLAAAHLPRETAGRIAVAGDGVETRGSVAAALPELLARRIPIDVYLPPDR